AHQKGVYHRDITSSNILCLSADPQNPDVRVIDFGVARVKQQENTGEQSTTMVGTPAYMAPDQARGLPYGERSEVYSLGCVMFEALTGRVPFEAASPLEAMSLHAHAVPPRLDEMRTDVDYPEDLIDVVETCLQKEPGDRFRSMQQLNAALNGAP